MSTRRWGIGMVLVALALWATGAAAEVYKSLDENGRVVFSQKPPKDTKVEVIKPRNSKPPTPAAGAAAPFIAPLQPGAAPSATDASGKPKELTAEQKAGKQKNCDIAHERLAQLQLPHARRLQYTNEQGELAYLTPDMLEQRITDAQTKIAENCAGDALTAGAPAAP